MKMEYDPIRDLLYLWFGDPQAKAAETKIISSGVHADFDNTGQLLGIEVLDASTVLKQKVQMEFSLNPLPKQCRAA